MTEFVTDMNTLAEVDFRSVEWEDTITGKIPEGKTLDDVDPMDRVVRESLRPKFDSVAAFKLHRWSLDSGHSEEHGNAVDWHRWSAIFRNVTDADSPRKSEQPAAILTTDSQGFVSAAWYGDGNAAEADWEALEKEWDDFEGDDDEGV